MKAITIWQPWASLLACGAKQYETRSWATKYRGPVAIHAVAKEPRESAIREKLDQFPKKRTAMLDALELEPQPDRHQNCMTLPRGCIIATAELVGCYEIAGEPEASIFRNDYSFLFYKDKSSPYSSGPLNIVSVQENLLIKFGVSKNEELFGDWTPGRYAWEFINMKMLPKPLPVKGQQGLWSWEGVQ